MMTDAERARKKQEQAEQEKWEAYFKGLPPDIYIWKSDRQEVYVTKRGREKLEQEDIATITRDIARGG
jgi:hypothetical protein